MDFVFDLLQGAGLAAAIGIRPFLPVLLAGALASADVAIDFDGTDFAFLESWPFLLAVVLAVAALDFAARRGGASLRLRVPLALGALAVALGALVAGGSVADGGNPAAVGLVVGALCAVLGFLAARSLFDRVRRRLDDEAAAALPVYAEGSALAAAGLSLLFPPLALLVLVGLGFLLAGGRRREGEKYAGLRILR
jgi:hypothetical protein